VSRQITERGSPGGGLVARLDGGLLDKWRKRSAERGDGKAVKKRLGAVTRSKQPDTPIGNLERFPLRRIKAVNKNAGALGVPGPEWM